MPTPVEKWTPARVRRLRERLGEDLSTWARRFDVTKAAASQWERGRMPRSGPIYILLEQIEAQARAV